MINDVRWLTENVERIRSQPERWIGSPGEIEPKEMPAWRRSLEKAKKELREAINWRRGRQSER
jgi:hypothetical protein